MKQFTFPQYYTVDKVKVSLVFLFRVVPPDVLLTLPPPSCHNLAVTQDRDLS